LVFIPVFVVACFSCQPAADRPAGSSAGEKKTTASDAVLVNGSYQFCYVTADDTAILKLRVSESGISGSLLLQYLGRERQDGKFENAYFSRDTLIADYRYWTDAGPGFREIRLLVRNEMVHEGFGLFTRVGDKDVYADRERISFGGPGMSTNGCGQKMPTFSKQ
jgi:hypothetical protein